MDGVHAGESPSLVCTGDDGTCVACRGWVTRHPPYRDGWHGSSTGSGQAPALCRRGRGGTACRRGWVPVCTGTTVGMGSPASPQPYSRQGRGGSGPSPGPWIPAPACAGACLNGNDGWDGWHYATVVLVVASLERVAAATTLSDVRVPPSHRLEALRGKREGQHSIRINDQWRVCFRWTDQGAMEIEVTDYH